MPFVANNSQSLWSKQKQRKQFQMSVRQLVNTESNKETRNTLPAELRRSQKGFDKALMTFWNIWICPRFYWFGGRRQKTGQAWDIHMHSLSRKKGGGGDWGMTASNVLEITFD